jgi:SAM-dependent methyltransferase
MKYTGIDFSESAIEYCKKNSEFEFICGDFIKTELQKYDLVYSHAVVDHVYDMDSFILKIVDACKKYAYITAYRGYFPDLPKHKMNWNDNDGCYYNDFSIKQIKEKFVGIGLKQNQYQIRALQVAQIGEDTDWQTIIEINKTIKE